MGFSMPDVRVILTNWRRPKNLIPIAKAFREQSVPVEIVVVDNSGGKKFALSDEVRDTVDDVITFGDNAGPACIAPAIACSCAALWHESAGVAR